MKTGTSFWIALADRPRVHWFGLLFLVTAVIVFNVGELDRPFYWDEAWVYAPAVKLMTAGGPGLLPEALDPEYSRGHPLLFFFIASSWATLFGTSATSLHAFAVAVSALLLIATFQCGVSTGSRVVGLAATAMLAVNELFLAQSGLLLPEMLLALFIVMALGAYFARRRIAYMLLASCALLTKEAAVAPLIAVVVWQVVRCLSGMPKDQQRSELAWLGFTLMPFVVALVYFLVQYFTFGWFFLPGHVDLLTWDLRDITYKARLIFLALFEDQGMILLTYLFALVAPFFIVGEKRWHAAIIALLLIASIKALWGRWPFPFIPEPLSSLVCYGLVFSPFLTAQFRRTPSTGGIVALTFLITIAGWAFCAMNFFTDRYLLFLVPVILVGMLSQVNAAVERFGKWIFPLMSATFIVLMVVQIGSGTKVGDTKLSYRDAIRANQALIGYCEDQGWYDEPFVCDVMERVYMSDPAAGYLRGMHAFTSIAEEVNDTAHFAVVTSVTPQERVDALRAAGFSILKDFASGKAWSSIWYRRPDQQSAMLPAMPTPTI